jgi:hypothetical protein
MHDKGTGFWDWDGALEAAEERIGRQSAGWRDGYEGNRAAHDDWLPSEYMTGYSQGRLDAANGYANRPVQQADWYGAA